MSTMPPHYTRPTKTSTRLGVLPLANHHQQGAPARDLCPAWPCPEVAVDTNYAERAVACRNFEGNNCCSRVANDISVVSRTFHFSTGPHLLWWTLFLKLRAPLCACFSAAVGGWWTSVSPWTWLLTVACYFSLLVIEIAGCWSCTTSRGDPVNDVLPGTVPSSVYHRSRSR